MRTWMFASLLAAVLLAPSAPAAATAAPAAAGVTGSALLLPASPEGQLIRGAGRVSFRTVGQVSTVQAVMRARVPDGTLFYVCMSSLEPVIYGYLTIVGGHGVLYAEGSMPALGANITVYDGNWNLVLMGQLQ